MKGIHKICFATWEAHFECVLAGATYLHKQNRGPCAQFGCRADELRHRGGVEKALSLGGLDLLEAQVAAKDFTDVGTRVKDCTRRLHLLVVMTSARACTTMASSHRDFGEIWDRIRPVEASGLEICSEAEDYVLAPV